MVLVTLKSTCNFSRLKRTYLISQILCQCLLLCLKPLASGLPLHSLWVGVLLSHNSGGCKSKINHCQSWFLLRTFVFDLNCLLFTSLHMAFSVLLCCDFLYVHQLYWISTNRYWLFTLMTHMNSHILSHILKS